MARSESTPRRQRTAPAPVHRARLSLGQLAPRLGDVEANLDMHLQMIEEAREHGSDLVLFPELSLTGYQLKDIVPDVALQPQMREWSQLQRASRGLCVGVGLVEESADHHFYNSYVMFEDGEVAHVHRKVYLPTYGLFEEGRLYAAGERIQAYDGRMGRCGLLLCEDIWHPSTLYILSMDRAEIIIAAAASPIRGADMGEEGSNIDVWKTALKMYSQLFSCTMILVNRVGFEDGLSFWGGSCVLAPGGVHLFDAPPIETGLFHCEFDRNAVRRHRISDPTLRSERLDITLSELQRIQRHNRGLSDVAEEGEA
jgi:predicted amidohydrolase